MSQIEAIIYKHGNDDYGIWYLDIPEEAEREIENILDKYRHRGCSLRGTAEAIVNEVKGE